ncbi:phage antirepressor [Bacillus bombysepticus]
MNRLQVFNNEEFGQVRTVVQGEEVLFVAKDVSDILGFSEASAMTRTLDEDEKGLHNIQTVQGLQKLTIINESGLYSSILRSRKSEAKAFRKWITSEVIPSIRRDGGYIHTTQDDTDEDILSRALLIAQKKISEKDKLIQKQNKQLILQQPLVTFAEAVQVSTNLITVKQLANLMRQKGIDTGQNRLFEWLRENGYLCKKRGSLYNTPTQYSMDLELFESQEYVRTNGQGEFVTSFTPKVTGKGQLYFINKFLGKEAI